MSFSKNHTEIREKNEIIGGMLYLVATPVGNLADLSERAVKVLSEVDFIAAEDTRNTGLLLLRLGIQKSMVSYFEHNKRERGEMIVKRLQNGESCALVTDAGTPAISDPGEDLVKLCAERDIPVTSVPGACAAILALTLSALSTGRFVFEGFVSTSKAERRERFSLLSKEDRTVIIYEAPHKLRTTLDDLYEYFGDRKITLCRELTKLNEEVIRTTIGSAVEKYKACDPRGEYVLVIEGVTKTDTADYPEDITEHVNKLIGEGLDRMSAMKRAAKERGISKSDVYKHYVSNDE
ncbi:MAG: 16S rRNA (cytidine(1402)-2'-O)-methyltransferase [Clostridia bacterium]|nr:16S rRNA (cytidine(1402)-2'-O)-methyltransferase [Clostridia bacterium]